ncbi:MAG: LysM peptidoglycan-binding domain-containing protein, partial [Lachnospiraceae bacterium]|nr:LysM peptidoglycan-binding domain-containing protein [Lachnospiraceae bacterium]
IILSPTEQDAHTRSSATDAAHLSRITQAYNREEAKVSFMWNVMNVLCLGFVVCVMAYGIISMNNYNKMQNMQASIDYCMAFIEENTSFLMNAARTNTEQSQPVSAMQQSMQAENNTIKLSEPQIEEPDAAQMESYTAMETEQSAQERSEMQALAQPVIQDLAQSEETPETTQALAQTVDEPKSLQSVTEQNAPPMQEQASTPQYYIVRRGDTLRTICYAIYGDYSHVDEICRWNNIDDPDNILYGQKLLLP